MDGIRILIIEDEKELANSIAEFLTIKSFDVHTCYSAQDALSVIDTFNPDLIISDITMPEMDGLELLNKMRSANIFEHVPFVFLTAKTSSNDMRNGMKHGADDYITKPFKFNDLLDSIYTRLKRVKQLKGKKSMDVDTSVNISQLTKKEKTILSLIARGESSKSIAEKLFISTKTVENHRYNITNKLNLSGQGSLLKFAMHHKDLLH